jgi:hypothetical protein
VIFSDSAVTTETGEASWNRSDIPFNLSPSMELTVDWADQSLTRVLVDLTIDEMSVADDFMRGTGPPGESINLLIAHYADGVDEHIALRTGIEINSEDEWNASFRDQLDIEAGMLGLAFYGMSDGINGITFIAEIVPVVQEEGVQSVIVSNTSVVVVGTGSTDGSTMAVEVPAGALPIGSTVEVAKIVNEAELVNQVAPPQGTDIILGFRINATTENGAEVSQDFAAPVRLEFSVDASAIPSSVDPNDLTIVFWDGANWIALEGASVIEHEDDSVSIIVETDHFTVFAVIYDPDKKVQIASSVLSAELASSNFLNNIKFELSSPEVANDAIAGISRTLVILVAAASILAAITVAGIIVLRSKTRHS